METWRKVLRVGIFPELSTPGLKALRRGLLRDDGRLTQGSTTTPPPLQCVLDWPVEGACVVGYCAWQGDGLETVGDVERTFARVCFDADQRLGESAAVRYFLNWYDDTPRHGMIRELLPEVERTLAERGVELPCRFCDRIGCQQQCHPDDFAEPDEAPCEMVQTTEF